MPKLSIILPVYNAEKYLERSIESLRNQTIDDIEIILVNDGSTDKSLNICKKYSEIDERIKLIDKKNEGVSIARNEGINISSSEYITFMDPDDAVDKDMYKNLYFNIMNSKCDITLCNYIVKNKIGEQLNELPFKEGIYGKDTVTEILLSIVGSKELYGESIMGSVWRGIYKKQIIEKYNICFPPNIRPMQDLIFIISYLSKCESVYINQSAYYYYYTNSNSGITGYKENLLENNEKVYKLIEKIIIESDLTKISSVRLINRYINNMILSTVANEVLKDNKKNLFDKLKQIKYILHNQSIQNKIKKLDYRNLEIRKKFILNCILKERAFLLYVYYFVTKRIIKRTF